MVHNSSGNSLTLTGLDPGTTYHFALYAYRGQSGKIYLTNTSSGVPGTTASATTSFYPSENSTGSIYFDYLDTIDMRIRNITYGNGQKRIIVMKEGSPVDFVPVDGQDYTPSNTFGNTTAANHVGGGNYVMYEGTLGNATTFHGLNHSTTYYVKVFEYNGSGTDTYYLIGNDVNGDPVLEGNGATLTYPTSQASNIQFSNILGTKMTVSWDAGTASSGSILIGRKDTAVPPTTEPIDFNSHPGNPSALNGNNSYYEIGTANYVVLNSSATSVNLTDLEPGTTYHFALYAYRGQSGKIYLTNTSSGVPGTTANATTATYPTQNSTGSIYFDYIDTVDMRIRNITYGNGNNRIIVMKAGSPVDANPVDGQSYTASSTFGNGSDLGGGNYVMYNGGTGNATTFYGLNHSTTYHVKIFEYNGSGSNTYYLTGNDSDGDPVLTGDDSTLTYPTIQSSNHFINVKTTNSINLNWTNGNGTGRMLVAKADSPVDVDPVSYTHLRAHET